MNVTLNSPSDLEQVRTDIQVKLLPRSSRSEIVGRENNRLKVKVTSPPVDGEANKALIQLLAKTLGISKGRIEIIAGKSSKLKTIRIYGLSEKDITLLLEKG
jgi:uncharacterized protein (TIGR00251 family)